MLIFFISYKVNVYYLYRRKMGHIINHIVMFSFLYIADAYRDGLYHTSRHYTDISLTDSKLFSTTDLHSSSTVCAARCLADVVCQSFSYADGSSTCEGFSTFSNKPNSSGGRNSYYYVKQDVSICSSAYEYDDTSRLCYKYYEVGATWTAANQTCYDDGGYLLKLNSEEKYLFLANKFLNYKFPESHMEVIWIQGRRDSSYEWWYDDGTKLTDTYVVWVPDPNAQPSNKPEEIAVVAFPKRNMSMSDADPIYYETRPQPFLCEIPLDL